MALLSLLVVGCGGSSSGGPSTGSAPTVSLLAAGPDGFNSSGGATGFDDSGAPVYATASADKSKWTVYAGKDRPLYDLPFGSMADARPGGITGKYVVGNFQAGSSGGVLVAWKNGDGTASSARYPGYEFVACDAGKAIVSRQDDLDLPPTYSLMDLSDGSVTPESVPAGARVLDFKGRYALCTVPGEGAGVYDTQADSYVPLAVPAGADGTVKALAVNAGGQALGVSRKGGVDQLRVWSPSGVPGEALDSAAAGGEIFMGWISADGARLAYKKATATSERQFVRSGGTSYDLTGKTPYTSLNGLNADGTVGFAADLSAGESAVTVAISYR